MAKELLPAPVSFWRGTKGIIIKHASSSLYLCLKPQQDGQLQTSVFGLSLGPAQLTQTRRMVQ